MSPFLFVILPRLIDISDICTRERASNEVKIHLSPHSSGCTYNFIHEIPVLRLLNSIASAYL